jgi:hypothetical protein
MLQVIKAKPNPAGKDKTGRFLLSSKQLGAEWIDIKNIGTAGQSLKNIQIYHVVYRDGSVEWELLKDFDNFESTPALPVGTIARIHSGSGPLTILDPEDVQGANRHFFTGKGYVWNNNEIDRPMIWDKAKEVVVDQTYYDAPVPDGKILVRVNNKLI